MIRWAGAVPLGARLGARLLCGSWPTCPGSTTLAPSPALSCRLLSTRPGRRRGGSSREEVSREIDSNHLSPNSLPQLDWGFVTSSLGSLSSVFLDMVLPEPGATGRKKKKPRPRWSFDWYASSPDVAAAYRRSLRESAGAGGAGRGRLVRGIIYEMSSLMVPIGPAVTKQGGLVTEQGAGGEGSESGSESEGEGGEGGMSEYEAEKLRNAELARRDWQGYLMKGAYGSSSAEKKEKQKKESTGGQGQEEGGDKGTVTQGISLEELSVQMEEEDSHTAPINRFGLNRSTSAAPQTAAAETEIGPPTKGATTGHASTHQGATGPNGVAQVGASPSGVAINGTLQGGGVPTTGGAPKSGAPAPKGGAPSGSAPSGGAPPGGGVPEATQRERALQELLGGARGGAIRAKYAGRLQEKQMLADARLQQGATAAQGERAEWLGRARRVARHREWLPMPGCAGILRHFKERLLHQSLLVTRSQGDLLELTDDMGGFSFNPTRQSETKEYTVRNLEEICRNWGVNPKEVIVVLGTGPSSESLLRDLRGSPFFVCHLAKSGELKEATLGVPGSTQTLESGSGAKRGPGLGALRETSRTHSAEEASAAQGERPAVSSGGEHKELKRVQLNSTELSESQSHLRQGGHAGAMAKEGSWVEDVILGVMSRVIPGFEHVQHEALLRSHSIHFDVGDMLDLKNIIEDLNGISYRTSTFVRGKGS